MLHHRYKRLRLLTLPLLSMLTAFLCILNTPTPAVVLAVSTPVSSSATLLADASQMQQGKALYDAGKFADAVHTLQQAVQDYKNQGDSLRQAIALSNLSLAYQQLGQWQQANEAITESLNLLAGDSHSSFVIRHSQRTNDQGQMTIQHSSSFAHALEIQGNLQLETGQAEQAIATWQQAESIYKRLNDANGITKSRINQAQAFRVLGYYRRALSMLTELRQTLQTQPDSVAKVIELRSLGSTLRLVGDLDQSRAVLQQSLEISKQLSLSQERSQAASAILFELGNTAIAQKNTQTAIKFYQESANLAPTILGKVQAQINLFGVLLESQKFADAYSLFSNIQTQLETLPTSQSSSYARIYLARSLVTAMHQGKQPVKAEESNQQSPSSAQATAQATAQAAAKLLATAAQHAHRSGDRRAESYAIGTLGSVYIQTGQLTDAQNLTQQALELAQGVNAPDISYLWYWQLGRLLKLQGKIPEAIAAYDAAVNDLRSLRGDLVAVNREVQFSFRESVEPVYRESVELLVQAQAGQPIEQNLDKARQRIEALQLAELDNFFREACLDARTVLLDKLVDQDNPTAAIVYPIILPNQLEVIVKIPQQPLHHHTIKIPKQEVERHLQQLQENLTELDATDRIQALSQQVYRWLIEPIEPDLERQQVNTLVFVLDGALRGIPMAGLYDGDRYLVEKYAVALSLGLQLFPPKSLAAERLNVLAAGLVEPPPSFQRQFPPLPEIRSEFDLIAKTGIATQQLLDQAFTSQALAAQVSSVGFNVVHLATHGQFSSQAKDTFILAADGPINVTQFDSLLRNRNQSRSAAIELLVLSACQTAEGDDRAILGLAGVAVKAGARSTLASLWHIDDRSTAILIGEFYRELAIRQVSKAEALRRAQITLLKNYPNYDRPAYWAAYVLVGNWL